MTTNGPRTATETTIRMCTPGNGWDSTASDQGEAGYIGPARLSYRIGREGTRQMDPALVDGYPRRQRRQVTASYHTLLFFVSFWFRSWSVVEGP